MSTTALIVAAGDGLRLGAGRPKALVELGGRTLLQWSMSALQASPSIGQIVVALPEGVAAPPGALGVRGGRVRSESVRNALEAAKESELVLIHDAARPLVSVELVERVIAALGDEAVDAAIAAVKVTDTIKRAAAAGGSPGADAPVDIASRPYVAETLTREGLWAVQTPQVFRTSALQRALDVPLETLEEATDDAWLIERSGGSVGLVASNAENLKITTPLDLELATLLLSRRDARATETQA